MNSTLLSKVVSQAYFIKKDSSTIGVFFVKLKDSNYKNFRPLAILHNDKLIIQIDSKSFEINFDKIINISFDEISKNIIINLKNESVEFGLVTIDEDLNDVNPEYSISFYHILDKLIKNESNIYELLSTLPNQINYSFTNQAVLPVIITSIFLITIGFILQPINFVIAWFSLITGFISGIIGLGIIVFRRS